MKAKRNAIHLSSVGEFGGKGGGCKNGKDDLPLYHMPKCSFDMFFFHEYTHISSSRGHMGLIRLPAQAPLSHLQNPAEVKVFLPPLIPAQTPGTWKLSVSVFIVEVVLLVEAICMAAGWPWWCNNRWIMQEAACGPVIMPDLILAACCANMWWWLGRN